MYEFISILFIVFGVLQIILFFKIWRMTNAVNNIRDKELTNELLIKARVSYLKGDKEKAYEQLTDAFLFDVSILKEGVTSEDFKIKYKLLHDRYKSKFRRLGWNAPDYQEYINPNKHL